MPFIFFYIIEFNYYRAFNVEIDTFIYTANNIDTLIHILLLLRSFWFICRHIYKVQFKVY